MSVTRDCVPTDVRTIPSTINQAEYGIGLTVQNPYRPVTISARPVASLPTPRLLTLLLMIFRFYILCYFAEGSGITIGFMNALFRNYSCLLVTSGI